MGLKYVKYTSEKGAVTHAAVPAGKKLEQVECEALCGELIYPPDEGDPEPEMTKDGRVDCPQCKVVIAALSCIRSDEVLQAVRRTNYQTT